MDCGLQHCYPYELLFESTWIIVRIHMDYCWNPHLSRLTVNLNNRSPTKHELLAKLQHVANLLTEETSGN